MISGKRGFQRQEKTGLEWINKAAAKDYPLALFELSDLHRNGLESLVRKSQEKANKLLLKSANLGYAKANSEMATFYIQGTDGFEKDFDEAHFRASVAFALDASNFRAAWVLGSLHVQGCLPEPSPYLACYYLNIAATEGNNGAASFFYSQSLLSLGAQLHLGNIGNRTDPTPAAFFWMRKSRDMGFAGALERLKEMESSGQYFCGNCYKEAEAGEKFKQCSKCRALWYCSKECQVEAWRAGHKQDCKRATILKFED